MRVRYMNAMGETCESEEYARYTGSDGRQYVVVRDWGLGGDRILLASWVTRISGEEAVSGPADLERVPAEWRGALLEELTQEVADMSTRELVFMMLEGMDQAELDERVRELMRDFPDSAVAHH
jgi:hypothetical protein